MEQIDETYVIDLVLAFKKSFAFPILKELLNVIEKKLNQTYKNRDYYLRVDRDNIDQMQFQGIIDVDENNTIKRGKNFKIFNFNDIKYLIGENELNTIINTVFKYFYINKNKKYIFNKKDKKICICGSMTTAKEMVAISKSLTKHGYDVYLPELTYEYSQFKTQEEMRSNAKNKITKDFMRKYYNIITTCDAILVVNIKRKNIDNYIGANSLLEIYAAHVLKKNIYLLCDIPAIDYCIDEIKAMEPIALNGKLSLMM